ncbi:metallophosphoesterase [Parapedobacter sp. ISTM3]|uniref:metallophosphoesterase n=1 Tax=Parapedobacter sp. ISTM3 TaxID=2800130 RepID=UPI001906C7E8|nr:metallophosphoesterase [Parapedobacter sp. ISTM3]MBK1440249.1 metallophosphoesterase [Parapedobacter sp. ISTM3]
MRIFYFLVFFAGTVYYAFTAVYTGLKDMDVPTRHVLIAAYLLVSAGALVSPVMFSRWSSIGWPSAALKHTVHALIAVLLGQIVMASVMFMSDLLVGVRAVWVVLQTAWSATPSSGTTNLSRSPIAGQLAMLSGGMLTIGLLYGVSRRYRYQVRTVKIPIRGLPKAFHGLRIVQLSDIHSGSYDNPDAVSKGVDMAMALRPDLILFSGDLVNNRAAEFKPYLDIFARLRAPLGVFSVLGNHDYGDYVRWPSLSAKQHNLQTLLHYQRLAGWRVLLNESVTIKKNGDALVVAGVENWSGRAAFSRYGNLAKALSGISGEPPVILLSHDPSHWEAEVVGAYPQIALTLSGHTHGMQFGIESKWLRWSPVQYFYKQWAGLYQRGSQYLYVNRGFGFLGYLGRLGMPPEIALLELVEA